MTPIEPSIRTRPERLRMAGFFMVLLLGFACTYVVMEPFPSPILPGFARVPDATDTVDMEIPRIIVIGPSTSDTLTAQQLFADTRNVSPVELLRTTFYHERESPVIARAEGTGLYHTLKEMRRSVRAWVATSIPKAHRAFRRNGIIDMSTRTWLQTRIHTLLPHVQAQRVRIEWYATEATVPFDVVEVALP